MEFKKLINVITAVVAVQPNQEKPLKIAMVVQSEPANYWLIKVSQIGCTEIKPFKGKKHIYSRKEHIILVVIYTYILVPGDYYVI